MHQTLILEATSARSAPLRQIFAAPQDISKISGGAPAFIPHSIPARSVWFIAGNMYFMKTTIPPYPLRNWDGAR